MWDFVQSFPGGIWGALILLAAYVARIVFHGAAEEVNRSSNARVIGVSGDL